MCISDIEEIAREGSDSLGVREYIYRARGHGSKSMEIVLGSGWPAEIKEIGHQSQGVDPLFIPLSLEIAGKGDVLLCLIQKMAEEVLSGSKGARELGFSWRRGAPDWSPHHSLILLTDL